MGDRTSYTPGTFSWVDLSTTDQPGAKQFYSELFGWTAEDSPVGDGVFYSMMSKDGKDVAAIAPQPEQQRAAGVPPAWQSYVTVESADDAAAKAAELGGSVHMQPFDVMTVGRMAVIQDPQGAFFMLWEPKDHKGAALVNAPGAFCWNELASPDLAGTEKFYSGLFGWTFAAAEGSPIPYTMIKNAADHGNGGVRAPAPGEPPAYWLVYFGCEDTPAKLERVQELGGKKLAGPYDMGPAKIAIALDPRGAVFALYSGQFVD
jgi:predicted enzyme related to lactoylglutathione lyase